MAVVAKTIGQRFDALTPMERNMLANQINKDTFDNLATSAMPFIQSEMAGLKTFVLAWVEDGRVEPGM